MADGEPRHRKNGNSDHGPRTAWRNDPFKPIWSIPRFTDIDLVIVTPFLDRVQEPVQLTRISNAVSKTW